MSNFIINSYYNNGWLFFTQSGTEDYRFEESMAHFLHYIRVIFLNLTFPTRLVFICCLRLESSPLFCCSRSALLTRQHNFTKRKSRRCLKLTSTKENLPLPLPFISSLSLVILFDSPTSICSFLPSFQHQFVVSIASQTQRLREKNGERKGSKCFRFCCQKRFF